jgi:GAF domain-containing protein
VARFQLRDISNRLAQSNDAEDVVSEFLAYLQAIRPDWRAALALYDGRQDALVTVYQRERRRLVQNAIEISVDQLPVRLVRKFFHPSAFFNRSGSRSLLVNLIQTSPVYEALPPDRDALAMLTAQPHWKSCVCLPLHDRENVLALLVLTSVEKNAFPSSEVAELIPIKSMASLALSQHMLAANGGPLAAVRADEQHLRDAAAGLHSQIQHLQSHAAGLEAEILARGERLEALIVERDTLLEKSAAARTEVAKLKSALRKISTGGETGPPELDGSLLGDEALYESQRTIRFVRDVFQVLAAEHRREDFAATLLTWYCEHFGVERCSLMLFDGPSESLRIAAFRGIEPGVARNVRVPLGQGIAGWVAHHRKPIFIRAREQDGPVQHTDQDDYNSDSFISVPLVYNGRMFGVLNLSNKANGEVFDDVDLDRAVLTGSVLGMTLGSREAAQREAAQHTGIHASV